MQSGKPRHRNPDRDLLQPLVASPGPQAEAMLKRLAQLKRASTKKGIKRMPDEDYLGTYGNFALGNTTEGGQQSTETSRASSSSQPI